MTEEEGQELFRDDSGRTVSLALIGILINFDTKESTFRLVEQIVQNAEDTGLKGAEGLLEYIATLQ